MHLGYSINNNLWGSLSLTFSVGGRPQSDWRPLGASFSTYLSATAHLDGYHLFLEGACV